MEAFDFAVGLVDDKAGYACAGDSHGFTPLVAAVAATVFGEYLLDGHTAFRKPVVDSFAGISAGGAAYVIYENSASKRPDCDLLTVLWGVNVSDTLSGVCIAASVDSPASTIWNRS